MTTRPISKSIHRISPITLRRISEGKYTPRQRALHDGGGLYLRLRPGGGSWCFRYERDGTKIWLGLGSAQHVDAPTAREQARQFRQMLALGQHPLHERREQRRRYRAQRKAAGITFKQMAEQSLAAFEKSDRHPATIRSWRQVLETYAYPTLGPMLLEDIERGDVLSVLRPVWGTKADTSRRLRRRIEHVFDEATTLGLTQKPNPARYADLRHGLAAFESKRPRSNYKALPWRQVPALMKKLAANHNLSAQALRLTILSAARTGEVLGARFAEFGHGRWTIPVERTKVSKEHRVPITTGIDAVLADLDHGRKLGPLLFANPSTGEPLSNMAMLMLVKGMGYDVTVHGFRSSFRDWCADHGYPREIAEAALGHVVLGVEGAYFRSDLFEQRRTMMQAWSDFCLGTIRVESDADRRKPGKKVRVRKN